MIFFELPVDVLILILNYLDTKSKINLFNTCIAIREYFAPCHMKYINLARSTISSIKTLNQPIFISLSDYIQELNLSGIPDMTAEILRGHLSNMVNLINLDLTFTNIHLPDFVEICPVKLNSVSLNFFKSPRNSRIDNTWDKCKKLFEDKNFTYIHFIVFEFLDSDTPLVFLKGIPIKEIKVTIADNYRDFWELNVQDVPMGPDNDISTNFTKLTYTFRDCRVTHKTSQCLRGVTNLDFKQIEYIYIMYLEKIVIYVSPNFATIFSENCSDLRIEVCSSLPLNFMLDGNIIFKAWHKQKNTFNKEFYEAIHKEFQNYFPTYVCMHEKVQTKITQGISDWYCIDGCKGFDVHLDELPKSVTLTDFCRRVGVVKKSSRPIALSPQSTIMYNITFLRLSNICVKDDFFMTLFSKCQRLETLDIYIEKRGRLGIFRGCTLSLSKSMYLAKCLRNIKITSEDIEYEILFDALSRCPSLENVHVCEYERVLNDDDVAVSNIILMIEKCVNLYSLFIEADMSPETLTLLMSPLRKAAQTLNRDYLCIEVCDCYRGWNPFVDVFNPSPLHILD